MKLSTIFNNGKKSVKANSPEILTAFSVSGVLATAYLTAKASFTACRVLDQDDLMLIALDKDDWIEESTREEIIRKSKLVWKFYIPPALTGAATIGCILGASHINSKRTAAAIGVYSITEKAFSEYREKVVEQLGENKEQKIRDELAQERVTNNTPTNVIIASGGDVMCCEMFTGRYFKSDMETLRRAQNDINARINRELYVTLDEFYDIIGLPHTSASNNVGWDSNRLMALEFATVMSPDGVPCISFEYNYVKPL